MGNHPPSCRIAIQVDDPSPSAAGQLIKGRVYLESSSSCTSPPNENSNHDHWLQSAAAAAAAGTNSTPLRLILQGFERTQITHRVPEDDEEQKRRHHRSSCSNKRAERAKKKEPRVMVTQTVRSNAVVVKLENRLALPEHLQANQSSSTGSDQTITTTYEVPFEWRLPMYLPSSMRSVKINKSNQCDTAEIAYTLSASLETGVSSKHSIQGSTDIIIASSPRVLVKSPPPVKVAVKTFAIKTALLWNQGSISFGLTVDRPVVTPGSTLRVRIRGDCAQVEVRDFSVRWIEKVMFQTQDPKLQKTIERAVVSKTVTVPEDSAQQQNLDLRCQLQLPIEASKDLRETYSGELIQVTNSVVVIAQTAKSWTTNPRQECPIVLVRGEPVVGSAAPPEREHQVALPVVEVHAEPVPADWQGETIILSAAQAMPVEQPGEHSSANIAPDLAQVDLTDLVPLAPPK